MGDKGQAEFEERLRQLFQALVQLMADVKNETLLTQVLKILKLLQGVRNPRGAMKFPLFREKTEYSWVPDFARLSL